MSKDFKSLMDTRSKTRLSMIIGITLFLSTSGFAQTVGNEVEVLVDRLRIRAGEPGHVEHDITIGYACKGEKFTVIGRTTTEPPCIKIRYSGGEGWISGHSKYVKVIEATAQPAQTSQEVKISILGTYKLRKRIQQTPYLKRIMPTVNGYGGRYEPIYWKFKNQTNDFYEGQLHLGGQRGTLSVIDGFMSHLSMPLDKYVELLKQDDISPEIEIYTIKKESWFTLSPEDYAIQASIIPCLTAQLKGTSIEAEAELAKLENTTLKKEKAQLENRVVQLEKEIETLKLKNKRSEHDGGIDALKALQSGVLDSAVIPKGEQQLRNELQKVKEEKGNLQSQLMELLEKERKRVMRKPNGVEEANRVRQLEEKFGRVEADIGLLRDELESLKEQLTEATKTIEKLQESSSKHTGDLILSSLKKDGDQFVLPLPNSSKQMKFVFVKSGHFQMGLLENEVKNLIQESKNPVHENQQIKTDRHWQEIKNGFLISKYEVIHEEYQALNPLHQYAPTEERKPVTNLTEKEIRKFCQLLNEAYPQLNIGLPTEKEWEYAVKGPEGNNLYIWGDKFDKDKANVGSSELMEVGKKPESDSWCGTSDMIGNAAEVCQADTGNYTKEVPTSLVARGGAYTSNNEYDSRTTTRHPLFSSKRGDIGFRLVIRLKK